MINGNRSNELNKLSNAQLEQLNEYKETNKVLSLSEKLQKSNTLIGRLTGKTLGGLGKQLRDIVGSVPILGDGILEIVDTNKELKEDRFKERVEQLDKLEEIKGTLLQTAKEGQDNLNDLILERENFEKELAIENAAVKDEIN